MARLRAASAVIFGKTNLPTLTADGQTFNAVAGATSNPWDLTRTPFRRPRSLGRGRRRWRSAAT
ncbi:amidase family protein [Nocardioides endophyticus]|uniref:amidase family protein n=1 Tax=Nocardioides endophyticus TaxID=1353775 RepID=UPI0031E61233